MNNTKFVECIGFHTIPPYEKVVTEKNFPIHKNLAEAVQKVDGVWITTPTFSHLDIIKAVAPHKKHIFVEKPVAPSTQQIRDAYSICKKHGVHLVAGWQRRNDPDFLHLKKICDPNWKHIRIVNRDNPTPPAETLINCGSIINDMQGHDINIALWFTGPV